MITVPDPKRTDAVNGSRVTQRHAVMPDVAVKNPSQSFVATSDDSVPDTRRACFPASSAEVCVKPYSTDPSATLFETKFALQPAVVCRYTRLPTELLVNLK
jgi:hypothetical protein